MSTVDRRVRWLSAGERNLLSASRIVLAALVVAFLGARWAGISFDLRTQAAVYLFGMVALNLPFGGYEHISNLRGRELPFGLRYLAAYVALLVGFAALFFIAPVAGLVAAVAVAVAKGGHGGLRVLDGLVGTEHLRTRPQRALAAFVRGGTVMVVPMYFWPGDFAAFSTYMTDIFAAGSFAAVAPYFAPVRHSLAAVFAVAVVAHLGVGFHRRETLSTWAVDAGETLLLVAYFAVVPVVIAVGLYFPLWYSLRQSARIRANRQEFSPAGSTQSASRRAVGAAFAVGALVTFGFAAVLALLAPNPLAGAPLTIGAVAFFTVFISIVALPHVVVGSWLDTDRGIWYVP